VVCIYQRGGLALTLLCAKCELTVGAECLYFNRRWDARMPYLRRCEVVILTLFGAIIYGCCYALVCLGSVLRMSCVGIYHDICSVYAFQSDLGVWGMSSPNTKCALFQLL
jgi:hypothetical protein